MRHDGYTLLELLVVIAILAVVAATATPVVGSVLRGAEARADGSRIATALHEIQHDAVVQQRVVSLQVAAMTLRTSNGRSITLSEGATAEIPKPLFYYPDGTTSGGRIILHHAALKTTVNVAWLTGAISLGDAP